MNVETLVETLSETPCQKGEYGCKEMVQEYVPPADFIVKSPERNSGQTANAWRMLKQEIAA